MILNRITKSRGDYYDPRHIEFSQGRFPTHLCLGSLLKFTVSEILEIRQTTGFIALRDTLRDFRKSELIDEQELQERIRYCFGDLGALFNNGDGRKSDIMREMREKHIAREQYFMINRLNSAVESIGFIDSMTGLTGSVGTILMMIFTTGLKGVMRNREISAIYKNYEFDPSNSSKIDPESGLIELA